MAVLFSVHSCWLSVAFGYCAYSTCWHRRKVIELSWQKSNQATIVAGSAQLQNFGQLFKNASNEGKKQSTGGRVINRISINQIPFLRLLLRYFVILLCAGKIS